MRTRNLSSPPLDSFGGVLGRLLLYFHEFLLTLEDLYFLALFPDAVDLLSIILSIDTFSMLLSIIELALVHPTVWPGVHSLPVLLVVNVLAAVDSAVGPTEFSITVHLIVSPFSVILRTIGPLEDSGAVLLSFQVVPIEERAVWPGLASTAFLLVLIPFTLVGGSFGVVIVTDSMSFIVHPLSFEHVAVREDEATVPVGHITFPKALELASIGPDLKAIAFLSLVLFIPLS